MKLQELINNAKKIVELEFFLTEKENHTFLVKSGGIPRDDIGLTQYIVRQTKDAKYVGGYGDTAYESETVINCVKTDTVDSEGRQIYLLPNNEVFVWDYYHGNIKNFDSGKFTHPVIA